MREDTKLESLWKAIEDDLFRSITLNVYERCLYYHLVRHTLVVGRRTVRLSIDSLAARTGQSSHVREKVRALASKGCIRIRDRNRKGTEIEVLPPYEISGCQHTTEADYPIDIEAIDFFRNPQGRSAIIAREGGNCFYCLRSIDAANTVLDHAIPQVEHMDHSYRNVVACCHECNSLKRETPARDFVRVLYRRGRLDGSELEARLAALDALESGNLRPDLAGGEVE